MLNDYLILDFFIGLNYILLMNYYIEYKFTRAMFLSVSKNLQNYVYIMDSKGYVIYTNNQVQKSSLFKTAVQVDINDVGNFFTSEIQVLKKYNSNIISAGQEKPMYLVLTIQQVHSSEKKDAVILTFVDVTRIIELLDELEEKKVEVDRSNERLLNYKERVFEFERKREIYALLEKISSEQYATMGNLKSEIDLLSIEDSDFIDKLNEIIERAKSDLKDVRNTVSIYRKV